MNVLFVTPWYPSVEDPVRGTFVREHARAAALHHDVRVLHNHGVAGHTGHSWSSVRVDEDGGPPVYRVSVRQPRVPRTAYARMLHAAVHVTRQLGRDGFRPEIIHAHTYPAGPAAALLAALWRVPYVLSEHLSALPRRKLSRIGTYQARLAFGRARVVLPVSRYLADAIATVGTYPTQIIDNAVDTDLFFPAPAPERAEAIGEPPRLLAVGSLIPVKGHDLLFEAVGRPEVAELPWTLDIVGDGPLRGTCEALAAARGVAERTTFHGEHSKETVAAMMRRSDVLVLASETENQSCVTIEAMASGLPVVAPAVGGMRELVSDEAGVVVPRTAECLAAALCEVLTGRRTFDRRAVAETARRRFSLDAVGQALDEVYRSSR